MPADLHRLVIVRQVHDDGLTRQTCLQVHGRADYSERQWAEALRAEWPECLNMDSEWKTTGVFIQLDLD